MNFRSILIPTLAMVSTAAGAQVPTSPAAGSPVTVQSQSQPGGARTYSLSLPGGQTTSGQLPGAAMGADGFSRQVPQDFRLVPGDLITVQVFAQTDYNFTVVIDKDGFVQLPYLGQVLLGGVTIHEASDMIASKLTQAGIYNAPVVSITFLEGPGTGAAVLGELHGTVPIFNQRTLVDVISSLGGFPLTASHVVTINRPGKDPVTVDLGPDPNQSPSANLPIFPGDTIITGRAGVVFVVGAFKSGGVIPLTGNQPITLMELCATTGGPLWEAQYDDLRLIRVVDGKRTLVKLNIKRVLQGQDPDPILMSNDILFLPTNSMKAIIAGGGVATVLSLASTALSAVAIAR